MMQATDLGNLHYPARPGQLNGPAVRRVLVEREMCACPVVVGEISGQDATQVAFAQNEDMIETLVPDRADESLGQGILPRAVRRCEDFTDTHVLHAVPEDVTIDRVAIAEEIRRGGVVWEGVHDLLSRPGCGGMLGDIEVEDAPAFVGEHDEDEQDSRARAVGTVKKSRETRSRA
jgi:hypothetical protein